MKELDPRVHITLYDLDKCMKCVVDMKYKNKPKTDSRVFVVHPGCKTSMIEFRYDRDTKNVKLLSDVAIVLKY